MLMNRGARTHSRRSKRGGGRERVEGDGGVIQAGCMVVGVWR